VNEVQIDRRRLAPVNQRKALEHDPEKWKPAFREDHAPTEKKLDHDPIQLDPIMI
jgi:hypothetical protein